MAVAELDVLPDTDVDTEFEPLDETVELLDVLAVVVEDTESDTVVLADIVGLTDTDVDSELDGVPVVVE